MEKKGAGRPEPSRLVPLFSGNGVRSLVLFVGGRLIVIEERRERFVAFSIHGRFVLIDQPKRLGQPAGIGQQAFGFLGHVALFSDGR